MNSTSLDAQADPRIGFMESTSRLTSDWGPDRIADLSAAQASRAALLAALHKFPDADPDDKAAADAQGLVWDLVDEAECFILDQTPVTAREAVAILDVLLDGEPQRSDGRDHDALRRVRILLLSVG